MSLKPGGAAPFVAEPSPCNLGGLVALVEYHHWANLRLAETVAGLTPEQYSRDLSSGHPSVRATLEHMVQAEEFFLAKFSRQPVPTAPETMSGPADARRHWRRLGPQMLGVLASLTEEDLSRPVTMTARIPTIPLWVALLQMVTHGTHHRGQLATMLRQLGVEPPGLDYVWFHTAEEK